MAGSRSESPLRRALEVFVFAPVGVALTAVEEICPARSHKDADALELQLGNARVRGPIRGHARSSASSDRRGSTMPCGNGAAPERARARRDAAESRVHAPPGPVPTGGTGPGRRRHRRGGAGRLRHPRAPPRSCAGSRAWGPRSSGAVQRYEALHPQPPDHPEPGRPAPRGAAERPQRPSSQAMELARLGPQPDDRHACTRLLAAGPRGAPSRCAAAPPCVGDAHRRDAAGPVDAGPATGPALRRGVRRRRGRPAGRHAARARWPDAPSGLIECCYVEAGRPGVGVGAALMEAALAWCAAKGCAEVDALALPGDRPPSSASRRPGSPPGC